MSQQDDISALLRIIREQQALIDDTKQQLDDAKKDAERYHRWWHEEITTRQNLEDEIKLRDEKEAKRA
jgi:multidrug resistance efflux pump